MNRLQSRNIYASLPVARVRFQSGLLRLQVGGQVLEKIGYLGVCYDPMFKGMPGLSHCSRCLFIDQFVFLGLRCLQSSMGPIRLVLPQL